MRINKTWKNSFPCASSICADSYLFRISLLVPVQIIFPSLTAKAWAVVKENLQYKQSHYEQSNLRFLDSFHKK